MPCQRENKRTPEDLLEALEELALVRGGCIRSGVDSWQVQQRAGPALVEESLRSDRFENSSVLPGIGESSN
jgi:hypothetical protein